MVKSLNVHAMAVKLAKNEWDLVSLQASPGGRAMIVARKLADDPRTTDFLVSEWTGEYFVSGNYDLTYREALSVMAGRFKVFRLTWG